MATRYPETVDQSSLTGPRRIQPGERPVCGIHGQILVCPACVGARGGAQSTPEKTAAARVNARRPRSRGETRAWTAEDMARLRTLAGQNAPTRDIALELKRTAHAIRGKLQALGDPSSGEEGPMARRTGSITRKSPRVVARKKPARGSGRRQLLKNAAGTFYARRTRKGSPGAGQFKELDERSKSLAADRRQHATTKKPRGQGDRGD